VAGDSSGNGNNGTLIGSPPPSWVTGKYGDALQFDGVQNYAISPNSPALQNSACTVCCWFKTTSVTQQFILEIYATTLTGNYQQVYIAINQGNTNGRIRFSAFDSSYSEHDLDVNSQSNDGNWHFVALVASSAGLEGYLDGSLIGSVSLTSLNAAQTFALEVGATFNGQYFNGAIDEVQVYNRALSVAEIQTYYQQSPDFSSNLLVTVPTGMTDFIATLSWQGTGSINATIQATGTGTYTETNATGVYQKTTYSFSNGTATYLNVKRIEVSVSPALTSSQSWYIVLVTSNVQNYQFSAETQT
jgi:hypothetical protein